MVVNLYDCDVVNGISGENFSLEFSVIVCNNRIFSERFRDDVFVGKDNAFLVDDEAGAAADLNHAMSVNFVGRNVH